MTEQPDISKELIQQAAEKYSETTALRAAIQLIPFVGGTLDTLIGGEGQKIQQRRVAHFVEELDKRLREIEAPKQSLEKEELYDLMVNVFEQVAKSRSVEKRIRFAQIISHEIATLNNIEDVELAIRLIGELDDIHIKILHIAVQAPVSHAPFDGLKVFVISSDVQKSLGGGSNTYPALSNLFPDIPKSVLGLICSELISKGLLRDEGVGRYNVVGMQYFIATDLASWLLSWITE